MLYVYLKVHLSAHASWPIYYSTHADLESSRGGNVRKFACLFFTLITIKCRSTSINSILRIFGMCVHLSVMGYYRFINFYQNRRGSGIFLGDFTWNDPYFSKEVNSTSGMQMRSLGVFMVVLDFLEKLRLLHFFDKWVAQSYPHTKNFVPLE